MTIENRLYAFNKFNLKDNEVASAVVSDVETALKNGLDDMQWTDSHELSVLYELAAGLHDDLEGYCLEFGTYCGGSAAVMAYGLMDSGIKHQPLVTVDTYRAVWSAYKDLSPFYFFPPSSMKVSDVDPNTRAYIVSRELWSMMGIDGYICRIIYDHFLYMTKFWDKPTRLIFLDGDHSYEYTKMMLNVCMNLLMVGGWLVVHDYTYRRKDNSDYCGVMQAVNEFLDERLDSVDTYDALGETGMILLKRLG